MAQQFPESKISIKAEVLFYCFIHRLGFPFKTSLDPIKNLVYRAMKAGNLTCLWIALAHRIFYFMIKGEHLDFVLQEIQQSLDEVLKYRPVMGIQGLSHVREVCWALRGLTKNPLAYQPPALKEEGLAQLNKQDLQAIHTVYKLWYIYLLYLYERYEEVLAVTQSMADDLHCWECLLIGTSIISIKL